MDVAVRSCLSAGVCMASASMIALSPVAPTLPDIQSAASKAVSSASLSLTATFDPLQPWIDAFNEAAAGAKIIFDVWRPTPAVLLQQIIANQIGYAEEIISAPGNIPDVIQQMVANTRSAISSSVLVGADAATKATVLPQTMDLLHNLIFGALPTFLPPTMSPVVKNLVVQTLNFMASPASAVLLGLVGPAVSPMVALVNTVTSAINHVRGPNPDFKAAVQDLINIPANMANGFLNGATLNMKGLVPLVNRVLPLPPGVSVAQLSMAFGGMFTPGKTLAGIGGSTFNALGLQLSGLPLPPIAGAPVGPLGAAVAFEHIIAKAIGWSGSGNPLPVSAVKPAPTSAVGTNSITSIPSPNPVAGLTVNPTAASGTPDTSDTPDTPAPKRDKKKANKTKTSENAGNAPKLSNNDKSTKPGKHSKDKGKKVKDPSGTDS